MLRSITMRAKIYPIFRDFDEGWWVGGRVGLSTPNKGGRGVFPCTFYFSFYLLSATTYLLLLHLCSEGKYLESSTIREDRERVLHKSMESTEFPDHLMTWLEVGMIGIHE